MSTEVDSRVVELQFDHREFEQNAQTSISTLEKLKAALKFDNIGESFRTVEKDVKAVDFTPMSKALDQVSLKFNALEIAATTALANITNSAVNAGKALLKSLTTDNIAAGWGKFGDMTVSTGTLVSQGYELDVVNEQLERLNWFTDETSYNLTDMVENIAKFTATGQDLETSVTAMEGIATWAALSGQNAQMASRAMYNISQAMGAGAMKLMDYKSIQNASMDTDEFRQKVLDAAVELGTLKRVANDTYSTLDGKGIFKKSQFTEYLAQGWFNTDVMMAVFQEYSGAVDQIYEYAEKKGITASDAIEELGDQVDEFGLKAFKAAQEARTWSDVIDSIKDAVSTGWMTTFQLIIGDYEQAKALYTDLANSLYDIFAEPGNSRNDVLQGWSDLGGREVLVDALYKAAKNLADALQLVKDAFHEIFPEPTAIQLANLTTRFAQFVHFTTLSESAASSLKKTLMAVFSVFDMLGKTVMAVVHGFSPLVDFFGEILGLIAPVNDGIADFIIELDRSATAMGVFDQMSEKIANTLQSLIGFFKHLVGAAVDDYFKGFSRSGNVLTGVLTALMSVLGSVTGGIFSFIEATTGIDLSGIQDSVKHGLMTTFNILYTLFDELVNGIKGLFSGLSNAGSLSEIFGKLGDGLKNFFSGITGIHSETIDNVVSGIGNFLKELSSKGSVADAVKFVIEKIKVAVQFMFEAFGTPQFKSVVALIEAGILMRVALAVIEFFDTIGGIKRFGPFYEILNGVSECIESFQERIESDTTLANAKAIALMAASLWALATLPMEQLASGIVGLSVAFTFMMISLKKVQDIVSMVSADPAAVEGLKAMSLMLITFSVSIMLLGASLKSLSSLSYDELLTGLLGVIGLMISLSNSMRRLSGLSSNIYEISGAMIVLAVAINLLVIPVKMLGKTNLEQLAGGLFAVLSMIFTLSESMKIMNNLSGNIASVAKGMIPLAIALNMLVPPVVLIGMLPVPQILTATLAVVGMLFTFAGVGAILDNVTANIASTTGAMILLSVAIDMLVPSLVLLGALPWKVVLRGLGELLGIFVELVGAAVILHKFAGDIRSAAAGILIMSIAIDALIAPIVLLGALPWPLVVQGLEATGLMLGGLVLAAKLLGGGLAVGVIRAAAAMVVMSAALTLLSVPIVVLTGLANQNWKSFAIGIGALAAMLVVMVGALAVTKQLGPMALIGAVALETTAKALSKLTLILTVVTGLANQNWKALAIGIGAIMAALAGIILMLHFAKNEIGGAVTFVLFARALVDIQIAVAGLVGSILLLVGTLKSGLNAVIASILALGAALVSGLIAIIVTISANSERIFSALTRITVEFCKFVEDVTPVIVEVIVAFIGQVFVGLLQGINVWINPLLDALFELLILVCESIRDYTEPLVKVLGEVIDILCIALGDCVPILIKALVDLVIAVINGVADEVLTEETGRRLTEALDHLVDGIMYFLLGMFHIDSVWWDALKNAVGEFFSGIFAEENVQDAIAVFQFIGEWIAGWLQYIWEGIQNFCNRWAMGVQMIKDGIDFVKQFVNDIISWVKDTIGWFKGLGTDVYNTATSIGNNLIQGFIDGLGEMRDKVTGGISEFCNGTVDKVQELFGIHSPSEVMHKIGEFFTQGFGLGISDTTSTVKDTVAGFGTDILGAFTGMGELFKSSGKDAGWAWAEGFGEAIGAVYLHGQNVGTTYRLNETSAKIEDPGSYTAKRMMELYGSKSESVDAAVDAITDQEEKKEEKAATQTKTDTKKKTAQEILEENSLLRVIKRTANSINSINDELDKRYEESAEKYDELLEKYKSGLITREQYDKEYTDILKNDVFNRTKIVEHAEEQMRSYVEDQLQSINENYESELQDIQSKMDSFSSSMQSSLKDSFEFTTQGDVYNQTMDEYQKRIDELAEKRDKLKETYGENYQGVLDIQKQIDEITKKQEEYKKQYEESGVKDDEIVGVQFTEKLKEDTKALEDYNKSLSTLMQRGMVTEDIKGMISGMSREEGKALVDYLNTLSDKELGDIIDQWARNQEASQKLADTLYADEIRSATEQYVDDVTSVLGYLPESANQIGKDVAHSLAQGFSDGTNEALELIGTTMNDILAQIGVNVDSAMRKQNPITSGFSSMISLISAVGGNPEQIMRRGSPTNAINTKDQLANATTSLDNRSKSAGNRAVHKVENSGTIKDKLVYYFGGGSDETKNFNKIDNSLNRGFSKMEKAFQTMQVILDANSLADGLAEPLNKKIGRLATGRGRGV